MPDNFTNVRPYYDVTFPTSGDGFSIPKMRNSMAGLGFLDMIPLQPRAHNPADKKIMVRGRDASAFFNPVYYGDANQRIPFASGDTAQFSTPVSNPRIDIVYMTPSGDLKIQVGTEAAVPTLPTLAPSGDSRFPICAVWNKTTQARIVNFEDKDSNSGDGYIYQDLRPWMRSAGAGSAKLGVTSPIAPTGDSQVGPGVLTTAAASDHVHGGVHGVRLVGSALIQGDVEVTAPNGLFSQSGNRITYAPIFSQSFTSTNQTITAGGQLVLSHGFKAIPQLVQIRLVNLTAEGGYSIGDIVIVNPAANAQETGDKGISVVIDAGAITIRIGANASSLEITNKTDGSKLNITNANWALVAKAWA